MKPACFKALPDCPVICPSNFACYFFLLPVMFSRLFLWLLFLAAAAVGAPAAQAQAKKKAKPAVTTVYLVRHAEKDSTSNPADPTLSGVGEVRAQALSQLLARRQLAALFTTDTKRTRATLAPLAAATKLEPQVYSPKEPLALAAKLRQDYAGKTVVVVGHSNTLLPLIEAWGATAPVERIGDNEYDLLFTVRLVDGVLPTVSVQGYGPERKQPAAEKASRKTIKTE